MSGSSSAAELQLNQVFIEAIIQGVATKLSELSSGLSAAAKLKDPPFGLSVAAKQQDSLSVPSEATESRSGLSQGKLQ